MNNLKKKKYLKEKNIFLEMAKVVNKIEGYGFEGILWGDDHNPAHFHIFTTDNKHLGRILITPNKPNNIEDIIEYTQGNDEYGNENNINRDIKKKILKWANDNNKFGINNWDDLIDVWERNKGDYNIELVNNYLKDIKENRKRRLLRESRLSTLRKRINLKEDKLYSSTNRIIDRYRDFKNERINFLYEMSFKWDDLKAELRSHLGTMLEHLAKIFYFRKYREYINSWKITCRKGFENVSTLKNTHKYPTYEQLYETLWEDKYTDSNGNSDFKRWIDGVIDTLNYNSENKNLPKIEEMEYNNFEMFCNEYIKGLCKYISKNGGITTTENSDLIDELLIKYPLSNSIKESRKVRLLREAKIKYLLRLGEGEFRARYKNIKNEEERYIFEMAFELRNIEKTLNGLSDKYYLHCFKLLMLCEYNDFLKDYGEHWWEEIRTYLSIFKNDKQKIDNKLVDLKNLNHLFNYATWYFENGNTYDHAENLVKHFLGDDNTMSNFTKEERDKLKKYILDNCDILYNRQNEFNNFIKKQLQNYRETLIKKQIDINDDEECKTQFNDCLSWKVANEEVDKLLNKYKAIKRDKEIEKNKLNRRARLLRERKYSKEDINVELLNKCYLERERLLITESKEKDINEKRWIRALRREKEEEIKTLESGRHLLKEMSDLGVFNGYEVSIYGQEGENIPHFHFKNIQTKKEGCIKLLTNEYFSHGKYKLKFSSNKEKKDLMDFLNEKALNKWIRSLKLGNINNYEALCKLWDVLNEDNICDKISSIPDYTKLS